MFRQSSHRQFVYDRPSKKPADVKNNSFRGVVETGEKAIESVRMTIESAELQHRTQKIDLQSTDNPMRLKEVSANDPNSIHFAQPIRSGRFEAFPSILGRISSCHEKLQKPDTFFSILDYEAMNQFAHCGNHRFGVAEMMDMLLSLAP